MAIDQAARNTCSLSSIGKENGAKTSPPFDTVINLDQGDPTVFEEYWQQVGDKATVKISGSRLMSYVSDARNLCWFLVPELEAEIRRLHRTVGNAAEDGYQLVVGNGSTQLIHSTLYALCPRDSVEPVSVVSAAPYYSCYPEISDLTQSTLYKWGGDACNFKGEGPYIELVNSPNNPDGSIREAVVKRGEGKLVHDLAYYWPHYTPITACAHFDIMIFTFSKCSGHAGSRIGWALVKDKDVARRMIKFIEISSIGVSRGAQIHAANILGLISDSCLNPNPEPNNFFNYSRRLMAERWEKLRQVVVGSDIVSLPDYPKEYCLFTGEFSQTNPGFAWMKSKKNIDDLEKFLRGYKLITRGGSRFGSPPNYARLSMVGREAEFNLFLDRLKAIIQPEANNGNDF
ncbi:L-tryptophan--pyruvate aminotransferase [Bertholletia excelsa]